MVNCLFSVVACLNGRVNLLACNVLHYNFGHTGVCKVRCKNRVRQAGDEHRENSISTLADSVKQSGRQCSIHPFNR